MLIVEPHPQLSFFFCFRKINKIRLKNNIAKIWKLRQKHHEQMCLNQTLLTKISPITLIIVYLENNSQRLFFSRKLLFSCKSIIHLSIVSIHFFFLACSHNTNCRLLQFLAIKLPPCQSSTKIRIERYRDSKRLVYQMCCFIMFRIRRVAFQCLELDVLFHNVRFRMLCF